MVAEWAVLAGDDPDTLNRSQGLVHYLSGGHRELLHLVVFGDDFDDDKHQGSG